MSTSIIPIQPATALRTSGASLLRRLARRAAYPSVLLANVALLAWAVTSDTSLEAVTFFGLLGTLPALFILEALVPHQHAWHPNRREALRDFFYFGLNGALDAGTKMGIAIAAAGIAAAGGVGVWHNALPFWLALPLAILVIDFVGYWLHRFGHAGWLWKVHGVHHTPDKVNTWNNNTIHFLNTLYGGLGKTVPLLVLGFDAEIIVLAAYVATLQSFTVHANVHADLGLLERFLMTPVHHRLHHSTAIEEAGNFASVTTLWDRLFGTFVHAPGLEPAEVGVVSPETFPTPNAVLRNQLHPFVDQGETAGGRGDTGA